MKFVLDKMFNSFVKINTVLRLHKKVLQKIIEDVHLLLSTLNIFKLRFEEYLFAFKDILEEIRYL